MGKVLLVLIVLIIVVFTLEKKHLYVRTVGKVFINSIELTQHSPIYNFELSEDVYLYIKGSKMPGTANPNNFLHLDIHRPPRIDHLKAKVTFQVVDPQ